MSQTGQFEDGKYHPKDDSPPIDGYEAIWSYANGGRKLVYPEGRYHAPICMDPKHFSWIPAKASQGGQNAWRKLLGVFPERELRVEMLKVDGEGTLTIGGGDAIEVAFVLQGSGYVGDEEILQESTIKLNPRTKCVVRSRSGIELLHFVMPMLPDLANANDIGH